MANAYNIPAASETETHDERRIRLAAEYDHTRDLGGNFMTLSTTQDAIDTCAECGRTVVPLQLWQHSLQCSLYQPHPATIAGQPGYVIPAQG